MSWKCDICDTYNDEREAACYVCGQARSAASIREGKIRAREERTLRINNAIHQKGYNVSKVLFFSGLISSLLVIIIVTTIKLSKGDIGSIVTNLVSVFEHMGARGSSTVPFNANIILQSMLNAPFGNVGRNIEYVIAYWGATLSMIPLTAHEVFINTAKNNFEHGYIGSVEYLKSLSNENLSNIGATLRQLQENAFRQISNIVEIFKSVFQNVKQYF